MRNKNIPIYLASKSPRRKDLLKKINLKFKVISVKCEEKFIEGESYIKTVKRLANQKLEAAKIICKDGLIITADTIVVFDKKIIGKPKSKNEAKKMLKLLSNKNHFVYTGFCIHNCLTNKTITEYEKTIVTFRKISNKEINEYINTNSPLDKAGAYGIQDYHGIIFVRKINGCYYNVMGLPLNKFYQALKRV